MGSTSLLAAGGGQRHELRTCLMVVRTTATGPGCHQHQLPRSRRAAASEKSTCTSTHNSKHHALPRWGGEGEKGKRTIVAIALPIGSRFDLDLHTAPQHGQSKGKNTSQGQAMVSTDTAHVTPRGLSSHSARQARARATDTNKNTECRDGSDGRRSPSTSRVKAALVTGRSHALLHLHQHVTGAQHVSVSAQNRQEQPGRRSHVAQACRCACSRSALRPTNVDRPKAGHWCSLVGTCAPEKTHLPSPPPRARAPRRSKDPCAGGGGASTAAPHDGRRAPTRIWQGTTGIGVGICPRWRGAHSPHRAQPV